MSLLRVYVAALAPGARRLPADASHYVARVHRLVAGDAFVAFDPEAGLESVGRIERVEGGVVNCQLEPPRAARRLGALALTLFQAPAKGDSFEEVWRAATALGVTAVHLVRTERSVYQPNDKQRERLRSIAIDVTRQSGRGDVPRLLGPTPLVDALSHVGAELRLCLHPRAETPLDRLLEGWTPAREVALLVGPEGGFTDAELRAAETANFQLAALGPLTLRAELAAIVALGTFAARLPGDAS